jgi:hypothetical protein
MIGYKYPNIASGATPIGRAGRAPDENTNFRQARIRQLQLLHQPNMAVDINFEFSDRVRRDNMSECRVHNMKIRPRDPSCGPGTCTSCALLENSHIHDMMKNSNGRVGYPKYKTKIQNSIRPPRPELNLRQHMPDSSPGTGV